MNAPLGSTRAAVLPQFRAAIAILPKSHHALSAEALGLPRLLVRHRARLLENSTNSSRLMSGILGAVAIIRQTGSRGCNARLCVARPVQCKCIRRTTR